MVYTDGSCIDTKAGHACGAGMVHPATHTEWRVDPAGSGPGNTVNRAELSGILAALTYGLTTTLALLHILTDSLTSQWQLHRNVTRPGTQRWHPHRALLQDIGHLITANTQLRPVILGKVPAHQGVKGNEAADRLAGEAARGMATQLSAPPCPDPYQDLIWPYTTKDKEGVLTFDPLRSLKKVRISVTHLRVKQEGIYRKAWRQVQKHLLLGCREYIHLSHLSYAVRKIIWKYWGGCLYNQKIAHRLGHAPNPLCPLCGAPDSAGHIFGACTNPEVEKHRLLDRKSVV